MNKKIYTVGNMVDIPDDTVVATHKVNDCIIFVGKMSYEPNIVAVTHFALNIFPKLKEKIPSLTFKIIGANPDIKVTKLERVEGVEVTGFVDTVDPYFMDSTIVVAPMLTGAGIQNKIIQAMSHACCVATSPIGAEGLQINDEEIAIYASDEEWINGILGLWDNPMKRKIMGEKARKYVIGNLSKEIIASQFENFINSPFKNIP